MSQAGVSDLSNSYSVPGLVGRCVCYKKQRYNPSENVHSQISIATCPSLLSPGTC